MRWVVTFVSRVEPIDQKFKVTKFSEKMIHPIPSIVVVDSDKAPEDQLRTMIILFRPTDSEVLK